MFDLFEWVWLALLVIICTVRRRHERQVGQRASWQGIPILEAMLMVLWGLAAGVLPRFAMFTPWLDFANYPFA